MASQYSPPYPEAFEDWNISVQKAAILFGQGVQAGTIGAGSAGLAIPSGQTDVAITYYGSTNNIQTVTYTPSGYVITMTYAGGGAADNDRLTNASGA